MNGTESSTTPASTPVSAPDLAQEVKQLRKLVQTTLVLVVLLSFSLNLFLFRLFSTTRKDAEAARPQINQMLAQYQANQLPALTNFLARLVEYSKAHPDLNPILEKYNIKPRPPSTAPAAATAAPASKPAAAAPPKK
jgi:hypothetical protein